MVSLTLLLGILSVAGEQTAEQLFGGLLKAQWMRLIALLVTIGLACGTKVLAQDLRLPEYGWGQTIIIGVIAGLGSNIWHGFIKQYLPGANKGTMSGSLAETCRIIIHSWPRPPK